MDPFIGEIKLFAGNFAPKGYALCNGQLVPLSQNTALFSILGVTYGGDGKTNFALPNLQGRAPMQAGQGPGLTNRNLGETGGSTTVTLLTTQMPAHNHVPQCYDGGPTVNAVQGNVWGGTSGRGAAQVFTDGPINQQMKFDAIGLAGGSQPHNNRQPYLGLNFIIALQGIFPPRP
ncbi:MAG: microcystin dependent protein [Symbiobacteriaceae bacterium]|jgi:microcystin-dependent protein|nr:microcystin dependent protein [Symbiobacteriaceae bacterium]